MLAALGSLASQQANPTENTMKKVKQFLDYAATHQDATITYRSSNMIIAVHSDASYLSETKGRSRAGEEDISFYKRMKNIQPTMEQYSPSHKSLK